MKALSESSLAQSIHPHLLAAVDRRLNGEPAPITALEIGLETLAGDLDSFTAEDLWRLFIAARDTDDEPAWRQFRDALAAVAPREQRGHRRPVLTRLADVEPEEVAWLWYPYIPLGKLTSLEGDPGLGKTWLALQIAANVTLGNPFPGQDGRPGSRREPGAVVYLTAEDGLADTLRPRLDAMGADVSRVFVLEGWTGTDPNTGEEASGSVTLADIDVLRQTLEHIKPTLLVVDPLQAYLGAGVDMYRANETRPVLSGLARLAEEYGCAVLVIRHLSKAPKDRAIYRGLGSIDFAAAARSILVVDVDPDDESGRRRVMAHLKASLAEQGASQAFSIRDGAFFWEGVVNATAEALLAARGLEDDGERRALDDAVAFLQESLADGPRPAAELLREAKAIGVASERTLRKAKAMLGVQTRRRDGRWEWFLTLHTENACSLADLPETRAAQGFEVRLQDCKAVNVLGQTAPPTRPCYACGGRQWWRSVHGALVCATCHPPAAPELVAEVAEVGP